MREKLKHIPALKKLVVSLRALKNPYSPTTKLRRLSAFFASYRAFKKLPSHPEFPLRTEHLYPRIHDNTGSHHLDPVYFYQNAWCAKKIFEAKPARHVDVASHVSLVSILSQFTPVTMVDIRPLPFPLPGLDFLEGDITRLPFKDNSVQSLSSICVVEHIGLGRYGDPLDPFGSDKALRELTRVLAPGGDLYITVPVDAENRVYFNAHRAFTRDYMHSMLKDLTLVEEVYLYGATMQSSYDPAKGFGTGMYHVRK